MFKPEISNFSLLEGGKLSTTNFSSISACHVKCLCHINCKIVIR